VAVGGATTVGAASTTVLSPDVLSSVRRRTRGSETGVRTPPPRRGSAGDVRAANGDASGSALSPTLSARTRACGSTKRSPPNGVLDPLRGLPLPPLPPPPPPQ